MNFLINVLLPKRNEKKILNHFWSLKLQGHHPEVTLIIQKIIPGPQKFFSMYLMSEELRIRKTEPFN